MRATLILADTLFVATVTVMNYNGGLNKNPLFLNFLVVIAFLACIFRHINYYKLTKRIY
jgi:hypothetical protein